MGLIIWIIIIIWIAVVLSKNKGQKQNQKYPVNRQPINLGNKPVNQQNVYRSQTKKEETWEDANRKQLELKARLEKKYKNSAGRYNNGSDQYKNSSGQYKGVPAKPMGDILERAKASVAEDFNVNQGFEEKAVGITPSDSGIIQKDVTYQNPKADLAKQKEIQRKVAEKLEKAEQESARQEEENVLKVVEELMVKGPNMELTFERDFLAEGMDMLNRIQA